MPGKIKANCRLSSGRTFNNHHIDVLTHLFCIGEDLGIRTQCYQVSAERWQLPHGKVPVGLWMVKRYSLSLTQSTRNTYKLPWRENNPF